MADAKIRLLDFASGFGLKLESPDREIYSSDFYDTENKACKILHICGEVFAAYDRYLCGFREDLISEQISNAIDMVEFYCDYYGLNLAGAVTDKMAYNLTREDHKHEARNQTHGKKF